MAYAFRWLVQKRVLYVHASGAPTEAELLAQDEQIKPFLAELKPQARLHVIMDVVDATGVPPLRAYRKLQWGKHPQLGYFLITGLTNPAVRFSAAVITKMLGLNCRFVATLPETLQLLNELDPTLPNLAGVAEGK